MATVMAVVSLHNLCTSGRGGQKLAAAWPILNRHNRGHCFLLDPSRGRGSYRSTSRDVFLDGQINPERVLELYGHVKQSCNHQK